MDQIQIKQLINKYIAGLATKEEIAFLETWYVKYNEGNNNEYDLDDRLEDFNKVFIKLSFNVKNKKAVWPKMAGIAAAVILFVTSIGLGLYVIKHEKKKVATSHTVTGIVPGSNKAVLTLANGKKVILDKTSSGRISNEAGITITKTNGGQLIYSMIEVGPSHQTNVPAYNTIETPYGGQYQINLPDGSRVWLNAASSLRFPLKFAQNERKIELKGEGYFEVAADKRKPFKVITKNQIVEVVGTHFNISSYVNDDDVKTTLMEGSVRVRSNTKMHRKEVILKPGEQSVLKTGKLTVRTVETEQSIAWKNGKFIFQNESLDHIMKLLSRWYDVEPVFDGDIIARRKFSGTISRYSSITEVLETLELTKLVRFRIVGREIKVMEY